MLYPLMVWCALSVAVLSMAGYRKMIAHNEDAMVHLGAADSAVVRTQKNLAERLNWIDRWGQILTVLTIVLGLVLASYYLYSGWIESTQLQH